MTVLFVHGVQTEISRHMYNDHVHRLNVVSLRTYLSKHMQHLNSSANFVGTLYRVYYTSGNNSSSLRARLACMRVFPVISFTLIILLFTTITGLNLNVFSI